MPLVKRYLWRVYCTSFNHFATTISDTEPTVCPTDAGTIDTSLTVALESIYLDFVSNGYVNVESLLADNQALKLTASDTNGGIDIDAGFGGITVDTTNSISLDAAAASNFTTTLGNLTLRATTGLTNIDGGSGINIGNDASSNPILIGSSSDTRTITIGNMTGASQTNVIAGTGGFLVDVSGGAVSLDATGAASNFTVATTGNAQDLTIAVTGSTDSSIILSSTGTGADAIRLNTTGGIDVDATGDINLASGSSAGSAITLDAAFNNGGINLSAGSQGIAINATGSGFVGIGHWSGGEIQIGTAAVARPITIGNTTGTTSLTLQSGTGTINLGSESIAKTINIGNFTGATGVTLYSGSGNVDINSTASSTVTANTSVNIGNTAATTVNIGNSSSTTSVNIDSGTFGITIGNNSANSGPIHIGNTSVAKTIIVGNSNGAGILFLRFGTSGLIKHQEAHVALSDADATITIANLLTGILSGTPTANRTLTLSTAALAVAGISGVQVNDSIDFTIICKALANTFTIVAGTGGSIEGNAVVPSDNAVSFRLRFTNIGSGTEAYIVYKLS